MRMTIVKEDNLVIIDNYPITFDLTPFLLPKTFWAMQWYEDFGEEEYLDRNEIIHNLYPYQPIIDEYKRLKELIDNQPGPKPYPGTDPGVDEDV